VADFRIPKKVRLPLGLVVTIKQVSPKEMGELFEGELKEDEEPPDGAWESNDHILYIDKTLSPRRKGYVVLHELGHAVHDLAHELLVNKVTKPPTRP
jgi:hypothetical protein